MSCMSDDADPPTGRGPGRPTVANDRRHEILSAFIELIAERGIEGATTSAVAERSGIARPAVRHFVGNRNELIAQTVSVLVDDYTRRLRQLAGVDPSTDKLIDVLFGPEWITTADATDAAFDALLYEASRHDTARNSIRRAYQILIDEITRAILEESESIDPADAARTSYVVLCLAEQNATLQAFGFDETLSAHCRDSARQLIESTIHRTNEPS